MSATEHNNTDPCWVLPAKAVAALLGVSERHFWKLSATGRVPRPVKLGRSVRWRRSEMFAWLDAGCPDRQAWEARSAADPPEPAPGAS